MGGNNSRLSSSRSSRPNQLANTSSRRPLSSFLICGGGGAGASTSNHAPTIIDHMEENPAEVLACPEEGGHSVVVNELQSSTKEQSPIFCPEIEYSCSTIEASSQNSNATMELLFREDHSRTLGTSNEKKCLTQTKEIVSDKLTPSTVPYFERSSEIGSSSSIEQQSSPLASTCNKCVKADIKKEGSHIFHKEVCSRSSSDQEFGYSQESRISASDNLENSSSSGQDSDPPFIPSSTDSSFSPQSAVENSQEATSPGSEFAMLNREGDRNIGGVRHVDVVSISSRTLFSNIGETSNHEARRNSRRLFWDAFSRRGSRRHSDSRTLVFSSEDTDDLGSRDRWLLDFSGDLIEDGLGSDSGMLGSRSRATHEGRWHSRSEIWERFRGGLDESSRRTAFCASGLHPDGTCSCESFLTAEDSSTRGSISRIVMLAEALFEVLDEIHRQPISLSLSMVSRPAPESVVNSFPLKNHKKLNAAEGADQDVEQCYICLAEYEEGDRIRVLPCRHEYHMSCVDKWLKDIHGVCPLCRGDVCAGLAEGPIST